MKELEALIENLLKHCTQILTESHALLTSIYHLGLTKSLASYASCLHFLSLAVGDCGCCIEILTCNIPTSPGCTDSLSKVLNVTHFSCPHKCINTDLIHTHAHTHTALQCQIYSRSDTWTGIALHTGVLIQLNSQTNAYTHLHTHRDMHSLMQKTHIAMHNTSHWYLSGILAIFQNP